MQYITVILLKIRKALRRRVGLNQLDFSRAMPTLNLRTGMLGERDCPQSRTQSNACARARMALALGKLTTGTRKFRGSGSLSACTIDKR